MSWVDDGLDAVTGADLGAPSSDPPRYGLMALTAAMTLGIFFGTLYATGRHGAALDPDHPFGDTRS